MKIALVTLDYPPERGGVARYLGNLVIASGGTIDVFVNKTHPTTGPGRVEALSLITRGPFPWWPMIWQLYRLKRRGYDHIFLSHATPVGTAAWIARWFGGLPFTVLLHGLDLRLALCSKRKAWILKRVLKAAHKVITNSVFVAEEVRIVTPGIDSVVLTPAVESMVFPDRERVRRQYGLVESDLVLLCVTRLVTRKGIDRIIEALGGLPSAIRLVVIGDGQDYERLQAAAVTQAVKERVTFLRKASDEERNAWYSAADIFILPVRDEGNDVEGFGIVYLEAALAGLPVIAGRSGGAGEAIRDGETGILVDPNDKRAIAEAIQSLYDHPDQRKRFGEAGRAWVTRDFRWQDRWQTLKTWLS